MTLVLALLLVYIAVQYALAWWVDKRGKSAHPLRRAITYGLALAVVNGSWFYLGGMGSGSRYGWNYLTGYIGPALAITLLFPLWRRLAHTVKKENIGSISDFLSARYGKSRPLGTLAAIVAIIASLPNLAGQLRALAMAWAGVSHSPENTGIGMVVFAGLLAGFAILFGTRKPALTEHNRGLMRVIALDAVLKLAVLSILALIAVNLFWVRHDWKAIDFGALGEPMRLDGGLFNSILMTCAIMFCAPRQFYISFVELEDEKDLKLARWVLPLFLAATALAVPPIVVAGQALYGAARPETYVLRLAAQGGPWMNALAFVGIASSISTFVALETVALASMVSNELVLPAATRLGWRVHRGINIGRVILSIRHGAIIAILGLSILYYRAMIPGQALGTVTLVAAAGLAQLMPALFGGLIWRRGHAAGAIAGIAGGFAIWLYYIAALQFLANIGAIHGIGIHLAASSGTDLFVQKVLLTQIVNISLYVSVSLWMRPRSIDLIQAAAFVDAPVRFGASSANSSAMGTVGDLKVLVGQFLGKTTADQAFAQLERGRGRRMRDSDRVDSALLQGAERLLAGAIGASLARSVLTWQLAGSGRAPTDVVRVLDDAAQSVQFNRDLMEIALAHLSHAVYVTDRKGRLKVWNARYVEIFDLPAGFLKVGMPITDVIRRALSADGVSESEIEEFLRLKLQCIHEGRPQNFEREHKNGRVLKTVGSPMPDGHYLTTLSDVTDLHRAAQALRRSNELLELNVAERTAELTRANVALVEAKSVAERASKSQARFLAAASHDLMQPLQAARLFIGALQDDLPNAGDRHRDLLQTADVSIDSANRLLRALLNLSRLEAGGIRPAVRPVDVGVLLETLKREFEPIALRKNLSLHIPSRSAWVMSDPDLLRSVLQNLIGNALRYTQQGRILVACRRDGRGLRFEVRDAGTGIPEDSLSEIFKEYSRLANDHDSESGAGLGLAIVERVCKLLDHPLVVRSRLGRGSTFAVVAPLAPAMARSRVAAPRPRQLDNLKVLHVENEAQIVRGMEVLLTGWGAQVQNAPSAGAALALKGNWDVVLVDHQLGGEVSGLDLIAALSGRAEIFALLTANLSETVARQAASMGVEIILKPVAPASLRSFLSRAQRMCVAAE
jgi:signal transduction histidine kinase/Na+/proline symporter/CheY-like chemotaxis protein